MNPNISMFYLALPSGLEKHIKGEAWVWDFNLSKLKHNLVRLAKFAWSQWTAKAFTSYKQRIHHMLSTAENVKNKKILPVARQAIKGFFLLIF